MKQILLASVAALALTFPAMAQAKVQQYQPTQQSQWINPSRLSKQEVRQIQQALDKKGMKAGRVDGIWGPETAGAMRRFQTERKINAHGHLTQQTLAALGVNVKSQNTAEKVPSEKSQEKAEKAPNEKSQMKAEKAPSQMSQQKAETSPNAKSQQKAESEKSSEKGTVGAAPSSSNGSSSNMSSEPSKSNEMSQPSQNSSGMKSSPSNESSGTNSKPQQ